ncbi:MAG: hypothetical protein V3S07_09830 [Micropepsaceae bacterium]
MDRSVTINRPMTINKNFDFSKNISINKNFDFSKNIEINKNFDFSKNIDLSKNIHIEKNIDLSKKIIIQKNINVEVTAQAQAFAFAGARAGADASTIVFAGGGGGSTYVNVVNQGGGDIGGLAVEEPCVETWAQVVSSIHAECIDARGQLHPATRMLRETWVDSSIEKELYRCLPGATLRVVFGEVVRSSHGMAGVYDNGKILTCGPGEALRHYTDGLVKCAPAEHIPDCTERENMRRYGTGDLFFSYAARVCAVLAGTGRFAHSTSSQSGGYSEASGSIEFSSMSGGVGPGGY